ncbi:MAG TPA: hypothetical protein VFA83_07750 [Acidimicrobiales bacterium]|nr:hypothetical protein [Acidimicrobiales bacterium]
MSFETAVYGFIGLIADRGVSDLFGDDPLAGPLELATDVQQLVVAPLPKAS